MAPSESYDPRTWREEAPFPLARAAPGAGNSASDARRGWIGLLLSAAILIAGAGAAWATRDGTATVQTAQAEQAAN